MSTKWTFVRVVYDKIAGYTYFPPAVWIENFIEFFRNICFVASLLLQIINRYFQFPEAILQFRPFCREGVTEYSKGVPIAVKLKFLMKIVCDSFCWQDGNTSLLHYSMILPYKKHPALLKCVGCFYVRAAHNVCRVDVCACIL